MDLEESSAERWWKDTFLFSLSFSFFLFVIFPLAPNLAVSRCEYHRLKVVFGVVFIPVQMVDSPAFSSGINEKTGSEQLSTAGLLNKLSAAAHSNSFSSFPMATACVRLFTPSLA